MTRVDDLVPYVKAYAEGVPEAVAIKFLALSFEDFCRRTWAWTTVLTGVEIDSRAGHADLRADEGEVIAVLGARFTGGAVIPLVSADMARALWVFDGGNCNGVWAVYRPFSLEIHGDIASGATIDTQVVLSPRQRGVAAGIDLPDFVSQYQETLVAGALARLFLMPKQSFSSPESAAAFSAQFLDGVGRAKLYSNAGYQPDGLAVERIPIV